MQRAVVIVQEHGAGQSPYFVLRDQPQRINAMTSFNDRVTTVCLKVCKQLGSIAAANGVGCDAIFGSISHL